MQYTSSASSWRTVLRRARRGLLPRPSERRTGWSLGVPLIALAAGLLFTTTATTAGGTSLRDDRRPQLAQLIEERRKQVASEDAQAAALRQRVEAATNAIAGSDRPIAEQRARSDRERTAAGFSALHGPGLTVQLNDAPQRADGSKPAGATNDDLVVHEADVRAVVNALWAGGAEAMSIMGVRVINTSAVRCVGNTLLLHGRVYSPPFVITAIGDAGRMRQALNAAENVQWFREAARDYGLGYTEKVETDVTVPAYQDSGTLRYAEVVR
ncbi:DUF881 domain-containing protein [Rhizomonospora bruguierae]|uniref:DUF881 domain-containing protein n=1 Tax=Rhizomonospora bruguierae TaxID=1581705 RepID=UPI001BD16D44|nr:DUF881 domain-containing protein [Micromonospora sp. NBRC 107566]